MAITCTGLRPSLHFVYYILTLVHLISRNRVMSEANERFHMSTLCMKERFRSLSRQIDGAVITSFGEENMNCTLTFQTETVLQRFMLKFEELKLDCHDHLYLFDGDIPTDRSKVDLSCRSTKDDNGFIFTNSNFLTLKYVTDQWSNSGDGFTLIITAIKDSPDIECRIFKCINSHCISKDLLCDGIDHCGDNSDETSHAYCNINEEETGLILGLPITVFIGLVVTTFFICLACVLSLAAYLCKREQQLHQQQQRLALYQQATTPTLTHPSTYTASLGVAFNPSNQQFATLPLRKLWEEPFLGSENMYTPAAGIINSSKNSLDQHLIGNSTEKPQQVVYYTTK